MTAKDMAIKVLGYASSAADKSTRGTFALAGEVRYDSAEGELLERAGARIPDLITCKVAESEEEEEGEEEEDEVLVVVECRRPGFFEENRGRRRCKSTLPDLVQIFNV